MAVHAKDCRSARPCSQRIANPASARVRDAAVSEKLAGLTMLSLTLQADRGEFLLRRIREHLAHRGDEALFFCDPADLQCLCAHCHNSAKQSEEARHHR